MNRISNPYADAVASLAAAAEDTLTPYDVLVAVKLLDMAVSGQVELNRAGAMSLLKVQHPGSLRRRLGRLRQAGVIRTYYNGKGILVQFTAWQRPAGDDTPSPRRRATPRPAPLVDPEPGAQPPGGTPASTTAPRPAGVTAAPWD